MRKTLEAIWSRYRYSFGAIFNSWWENNAFCSVNLYIFYVRCLFQTRKFKNKLIPLNELKISCNWDDQEINKNAYILPTFILLVIIISSIIFLHWQIETTVEIRELFMKKNFESIIGNSQAIDVCWFLWWFQWNIKKLRSFIKVSKNERRTYLTNFIAVSISNGYKTKLNSNFVLALSLSYWPINHMSEVNSPTNRNLILTSTDLQLMNSIVPKPYMILMKCWWK